MGSKIFAIPILTKQNYRSFSSLAHSDLPDTYEQWLELHATVKAERDRLGFVRPIDVDVEEFKRYCCSRNVPPNGCNLIKFAEVKLVFDSFAD